MARYTAEEASALILDDSDDQSDSDGSGSEIDEDSEHPLPHSDSDDQDSEDSPQPDRSLIVTRILNYHLELPSSPHRLSSLSSDEDSSYPSARGME